LYNPFFFKDYPFPAALKKKSPSYNWYISADQIFRSNTEGLEKFSKFFGMEFRISRFSLFDGEKSFDSAVSAKNVKIYMGAGGHCAMIQGRLTKGIVIPKIIIKKTAVLMGKTEILETKEFSKCVIQSFLLIGEVVSFSFRYSSYADSYTDFNEDGTVRGTTASKIDLIKWEVENS
jgi:hypothetical protein